MQQHAAKLHKDQKIVLLSEQEYRSRVSESKKICPICNKLFQADHTCKRHIQTVHREEKVEPEPERLVKKNDTPLLYVRVWDDFSQKKCEVIIPTSQIIWFTCNETVVMSSRVFINCSFLRSLIKDCNSTLIGANQSQIEVVVEILHNIGRVPFTRQERKELIPFLPVIHHIASLRSFDEAYTQLVKFGPFILPIIIPAVLSYEGI